MNGSSLQRSSSSPSQVAHGVLSDIRTEVRLLREKTESFAADAGRTVVNTGWHCHRASGPQRIGEAPLHAWRLAVSSILL